MVNCVAEGVACNIAGTVEVSGDDPGWTALAVVIGSEEL